MSSIDFLTPSDRRILLRIAREAIENYLQSRDEGELAGEGALGRPAGAFVTLRKAGALRGCIGHVGEDRPLISVVARSAIAAATADPRFPRVMLQELLSISIEISVLTPAVPVADVAQIEIGRHGLIVERGVHRGLLLPQVASEWGWDVPTFIRQTCLKAGLPADAWRAGGRLLSFEAEVFGENE